MNLRQQIIQDRAEALAGQLHIDIDAAFMRLVHSLVTGKSTHDFDPTHIHVRRENMVATFWLEPVVLERAGGFNRAQLNTIAKLVHEHRAIFLERWYEFFGR
jgi:hypothetical protein